MNPDIKNSFILAACFLGLFVTAEVIYRLFPVKAEYTRKLVHTGTGLLALLFPVLLSSHWAVLILCAAFALILTISLQYKLLPSINAIERQSAGSLAYPAAVYICFLVYEFNTFQYIYYYLPILVLAICDPMAALTGSRWQWGKFQIRKESKTLMGSTMFFISAVVLILLMIRYTSSFPLSESTVMKTIFIALTATVTEAITKKGWDNLSIPMAVLLGMVFLF